MPGLVSQNVHAMSIGYVADCQGVRKCGLLAELVSSESRPRHVGSGGQTESLHFIGVLSFDDEFSEGVVRSGIQRNSGMLWRSALATTSSEGGIPGRMVRSQEPKASQTRCGKATAKYEAVPGRPQPPG